MPAYAYAAYNAAPADLSADQTLESLWYSELRSEPLIGGLELSFNSFNGGLHPRGVRALARLLEPDWRNVVTNIPGTIAAVAKDARYGLASSDPEGRAAAVQHVRLLHDQVRELQDANGEEAVKVVELHSAPVAVAGASSIADLSASLVEIASWDWGSVQLILEHADALVDHPHQKGWMALADEMTAVARARDESGQAIRHGVNWGRSAIESRDAQGPVEHLTTLRDAGVLGAFVVSGASGLATARSEPWGDVHLALSDFEPESILTTHELERALAVIDLDSLAFLGVKVGRDAHATTLAGRLAPGLATLHALDRLLA
jgi:hypothetical protein